MAVITFGQIYVTVQIKPNMAKRSLVKPEVLLKVMRAMCICNHYPGGGEVNSTEKV